MPTLMRKGKSFAAVAILSLLAILLVAVAPFDAAAQSDSASVSGRVTDQQNAVIPNVEIEIRNVDTNSAQVAKTNGDGIYTFASLRPGNYVMSVRKEQFETVSVTGVTLHVQDSLSRNFTLQIGSSAVSVTVEANGINFNTTDASVSTVIDRNFVANMPLNGRSFQDLLTLAPGVTLVGNAGSGGNTAPGSAGEITVNGQRTEANYFTVDGVSATLGTAPGAQGNGAGFAGATPAETALGTTQNMISIDALQEFRASTSTYSAEYGRTPGGQFSFTTRAGTNDWHGSAYDYFRNEALDANNWFNGYTNEPPIPKEKERQNDFGGTLGGPVFIPRLYNGKNKTFFFFSYEGLRLWTPQGVQTTPVPDSTLRSSAPPPLQPLLNAFPLPNSGEDGLNDGFGLYKAGVSYPSSIDSVSVRVDHSFGERLKVFGRFANTPNSTSLLGAGITNKESINSRLLTIGAVAVLTPRQTNELRFNITQSNSIGNEISTGGNGGTPFNLSSMPGPNGSAFPALGGALHFCFCFGDFFSSSYGQTKNTQRQYNLIDTHTWTIANHQLKFGVDWRRLVTNLFPSTIQEYAFFFSEASLLANSIDSPAVVSASPAPVEPVYTNFSSFIQDDWKLTRRVSLSLGLRWDVNPAPGNLTGPSPYTVDQITNLAGTKVAPAGTPLWRTDWHGFAPRIGVAYQLRQGAGRETVLRFGFGTFYDLGSVQGSQGFYGFGFQSFNLLPAGAAFPLTSSQLSLPEPSIAAPYNNLIHAFDPNLKLPYTLQWNLALEQALGRDNALTVTYLGSGGRRLLTSFQYAPEDFGNPNFSAQACGGCLLITKNSAASDYNALQLQFQRKLSHGLQAIASYTFSHSIDNASNNFFLSELLRSSSDFDLRHNFQAALTYEVPKEYSNPVLAGFLEHWGLDTRISARSALPVNLIGSQSFDAAAGTFLTYNPDSVPGVPQYLFSGLYPGGKILNFNAYAAAPTGVQGNAGRNSARGFGEWQVNLALHRDFPLHEQVRLQFRAEAFNVFNHPNFAMGCVQLSCGAYNHTTGTGFGVAQQTLNSQLGGLNALYQFGGPRSLQLALKLVF